MIKLKTLIFETVSSSQVYGLGIVDSHGVVHFKQLTDAEVGTKTHSQVGLPGARDRFRYFDGIVGWTDTPSDPDVKIAVQDFLEKHNYPFKRHMGYFGDTVDENISTIKLRTFINEAKLRGEWWFQDGQAVFADGDVGDMNHENYVIEALSREILESLGADVSGEVVGNFKEYKDEIFQEVGDQFNEDEKELWASELYQQALALFIKRTSPEIYEKWQYCYGNKDAREYALIHWGWQRVKGNVIQTQTLTTQDLSNIVRGLYDAYGSEMEDDEDPTFDIEVMSTRSFYQGVPISILEKKSPTALAQYRNRYE